MSSAREQCSVIKPRERERTLRVERQTHDLLIVGEREGVHHRYLLACARYAVLRVDLLDYVLRLFDARNNGEE